MQLSSKYRGHRSAVIEVEVTHRRAMSFAAGIWDANPVYFDDEAEGGVLAHPMLAVSLTWPLSACMGEYWDVGDFPFEVLMQQVHYSERIVWHRPVQAGQTLQIQGEVHAILPHRAGAHLILRYDAVDEQENAVFTEYTGALLRDVEVTDGPAGDREPKTGPSFRNRDPLREKILHIDPLGAHIYDACADVHFPIHTSVAFAHDVGLPGIIFQGTATLALAVRELVNTEGNGDPRKLDEVSCLFTGMVQPGSDITIRTLRREEDENARAVYFDVLNADGGQALRNGMARIRP
jgi:acyl dehydratase